MIASVLDESSREEQLLKKQLAEAEAKAKAQGKELSARERKMIELKMKMAVGRKANALGAAEEAKKNALKLSDSDGGTASKKGQLTHAEYQSNQRAWEESQREKGLDPALAYLSETADSAATRAGVKKEKDALKNKSFGWEVFNQDAQFNAYNKRLNYLPTGAVGSNLADGSSASSSSTSLIPTSSTGGVDLTTVGLSYGQSSNVSKAGMDRMVAELEEGAKRREKFSRRRAFNEDEDVSYINERNRIFNKKANRAYEAYTLEIKQNLERGTAL